MKSKLATALGLFIFTSTLCSTARAVDLSFSQLITPPSAAMAGTAPWLNVNIVDTATPGTVAVTVSANLTGAQTLTGLWLNIPSVAGALTSFTLDPAANGSGEDPFAFAAINVAPSAGQSGVSTLQNTHPAGTTQAQVGDYNLFLRFPNAGSTFQTNESESFNLVANAGSGLTAGSFLAQSLQNPGGNPNPPYYALASFTNAGGVGGSGTAFVAANVVAVPEPQTYVLMIAGLGLLGFAAQRKHAR
jgi:hypothetical protein